MTTRDYDPETLAGQRLMTGFNGTEFNPELAHLIQDLKVGGLILFAYNIKTPKQVRRLCLDARECARAAGAPPLFMAVDQEGGEVARFKAPLFKEYPGNPGVKEPLDAETLARDMAHDLKELGINMNLAPVLDVVPRGCKSIMDNRVFKGDAEKVALLGSRYIETIQEKGVMAVAKHFPGIGRTSLDSHLDLPVLETPGTVLDETDLLPFKKAIESGVAGIMLSHILYTGLDKNWPASLSLDIAGDLLRNRLNYQGLVMTDDLDMQAIRNKIETSVSRILRAGIDLALICHAGPDIEAAHRTIMTMMKSRPDLAAKAERSMQRIARAKKQL